MIDEENESAPVQGTEKEEEEEEEDKGEKDAKKRDTNNEASIENKTDEDEEEEDAATNLPVYTPDEVDGMYSCTRAVRTARAYYVSSGWNTHWNISAPILLFGTLAMYFANQWFIGLIKVVSPGPWIAWAVEIILLAVSVTILLFKQDVASAFFEYDREERMNSRCCGCCTRAKFVFSAYFRGRQINYERIDTSTWFFAGVASFMAYQVIQDLIEITISSLLVQFLVDLGLFLIIIVGLASNRGIAMALLTTPSERDGVKAKPPTQSAADAERAARTQIHSQDHAAQIATHNRCESARIDVADSPSSSLPVPLPLPLPPSPSPPPSSPPPPSSSAAATAITVAESNATSAKRQRDKHKRGSDEDSSHKSRSKSRGRRRDVGNDDHSHRTL
jgi:hypothetical protein